MKSNVNPGPALLQAGGLSSNANTFQASSHNNPPPTYTLQHSPLIHHPGGGVHLGSGTQAMGVPKPPAHHLSNNAIDQSIGFTRPMTTTSAMPPNQYANVPRPILSNTSFLYGKT